MKRYIPICLLLVLLLTACGSPEPQTVETQGTQEISENSSPKYDITLALPAELQEVAAFDADNGTIYGDEDLTLMTQTLRGDSLDELLRELTGRGREDLTLVTTWQDNKPRHQLAWTCGGEGEMQVCQSVILDDGTHYYVVTAMVPESRARDCQSQIAACLSSVLLTENVASVTEDQENQSTGKP